MARYDVYQVGRTDLVVDVQSDYLPPTATRLVIPLALAPSAPRLIHVLNPHFTIGDQTFVLITQQMSALRSLTLGRKVSSLSKHADQIARAIDVLLYGF